MGGRTDDTSDGGSDDTWVFDDDFVAGGIREDSLRHRRAAPSSHSAVGNPSGPRDWSSRWSDTSPRPPRNPYGVRMVLALLAAVALVVVVVRVAGDGGTDDRTPIAASAPPSAPAGTSTGEQTVDGITPVTPVGTCLRGTASPGVELDVHETSCGERHDYELVARERASGRDDAYPDDSYWDGAVAQRCYTDVRRYTGQPRDRWPDHLVSTQFVPRPAGWAAGDRVVYCLAQWQPATSGSVAHLPAARRSVVGSSTPRPSMSARTTTGAPVDTGVRTVTGRLFVQTRGQDVCLSVRSPTYTGPVVATAAGLSWRAAVDDTGRPDRAGSGIALATQADAGTIRWHPGDRVTLTGDVQDSAGQGCGSATVLGFTAAR